MDVAAARVRISGAPAHEDWSSLAFDNIGTGGESSQKLILKVLFVDDAVVEELEGIARLYNFAAVKLYKGRTSDLLFILYLNYEDTGLAVHELHDVYYALGGVPFRPNNAGSECGDGCVWQGPSGVADCCAVRVL